MATNTGKGGRKGPITNRKQSQNEDGAWEKKDLAGHPIAIKQTAGPWKSVRKTK